MDRSRDRLALLMGLILIAVAVALIAAVAIWLRTREGTVELVKGLSLNWSSIKFCLVVAGLLIAPAGFLLATLRWKKGLIALNVELMIILCAALLTIVSMINYRYYRREDWTAKGRYGLSDQTINLLKESVKKKVTIRLLAVAEDPELYRHLTQLLKEYESYCGNVQLIQMNPDANPEEVAALLKRLEIKTLPAIIIEYGDRHEEITRSSLIEYPRNPMGGPMQGSPKFKVEEEVTSAIMKLVDEKPVELYFVTGHGERDPEDYGDTGLSDIRKQLERSNYKIKKINLAKDPIPEGGVLIIAGPKKAKFEEVEIKAIRNFLSDETGKVLALVDPIHETKMESGLAPLFQEYDVTLREDATVVNWTLDLRTMRPALTPEVRASCDEVAGGANEIVSKMQDYTFLLLYACPIETKPSDQGGPPNEGFKALPILRVQETLEVKGTKTEPAWGETELKQGESLEFNPDKGDLGPPVDVGVAIEPSPPRPPSPYMPPPPEDATPKGPRIVLIGDSDFATNQLVKHRAANANLFTNCVAWLAAKKGKLGIPPKDIDIQRLDRDAVDGARRVLAIFLFVIVLPTMVGIVLGSVVWVFRRK